ncbi:MAG: S9 family peptidase [Acidobacteriota bacterium]
MKKLFGAVALLVLASGLLPAEGKRLITEKDIFRFTWIGDPQLSPDGSQVAYARVTVDSKGEQYETSIWSVPSTPGGTPRQMTNGPRDQQPRWSPDGKTLAFLRAVEKDGKPQPPQIYLLPLGGGEPRALTSIAKGTESIEWSPKGDVIAFTATTKPDDLKDEKKDEGAKSDKKEPERISDVRIINQAIYRMNGPGYADPSRHTHIWTISVPTSSLMNDADPSADSTPAKAKQLTSGDFDEGSVAWSPDGSRLYYTSTRVLEAYYDREGDSLYALSANGSEPVKVATLSGGDIGQPVPSPDGKWIAFRGQTSEPVRSYDQSDLYVVSSTAGSTPRNLTATYDNDILSGISGDQAAPRAGSGPRPVWSTDGRSIYLTSIEKGRSNLMRVAADGSGIEPVTTGNHAFQGWSMRGGRTVAVISTPTMIGELYNIDDHGSLTQLTRVNGKLFDELNLTEPEDLWYTSFDGKKIETWVQRPPNYDPSKKYPLILNIHGGPHTAYGYTFDHEFQWMAAKGYVVVYPNPRGSTSYGAEFANIIQYKYPGDDYKDLMAGVDAVIARGGIDTKKLGVTGGSGGGLLTNWVITQTDRFAAAVSQRDIADWSTLWYVSDFAQFHPSWFRKAPWEDPQDYAQRSPITHVANIKTPVMFILGESDWRTPPMAGGEMLFRALKYLRRPAVMVRFPGESHELSRSGNPWHRVERLQNIVGWFDKWLLGVGGEQYDVGVRAR